MCLFSVGQKLQIFQKAWGLFKCFLLHYVCLAWLNKIFSLTCRLLSFKFSEPPCYFSDGSWRLFKDEFTDVSTMFVWLLWRVKRDYKCLREKPCLFLMPQEVSFLKKKGESLRKRCFYWAWQIHIRKCAHQMHINTLFTQSFRRTDTFI